MNGASAKPERFYRPELDGLRFLAFWFVFLHHAIPLASPRLAALLGSEGTRWYAALVASGGFGVDLFFVLSSYLITSLLQRERDATGTVSVKDFYVRRALRIWPLYFVFLVAVIAWSIVQHANIPASYWGLFAVFLGNWAVVVWGYLGAFSAHLWSISVEEQFYLAWPLLMRTWLRRSLWPLALCMVLFSLAVRVLVLWIDAPHPAVWSNTVARLEPLALGAFLAQVRIPEYSTRRALALFLGGLFAWVLAARFGPVEETRNWFSAFLTYPLAALGSSAMLVSVLGLSGRARAVFTSAPLRYLGKISYGLYVFHPPALALGSWLAQRAALPGLGTLLTALVAFLVTLGAAAISYRWLEEPFLRIKRRFTKVESRPD